MPGQTIADRYRVERSIGRGGMGTVWLARDQRLGRRVAVKQIGLMPGEAAPDLARAMREARSSAVLNNPHVVSVFDVEEEDDHIWLVMEYVESRTLWQMISQDGPLTPEAAVSIGAQVADGLAAAHAAGTIHRDVKPGNVLVTADGIAKISDFGIARAHEQGQLTRTGLVIGTPEYFSPELARGEEPTAAADVWALGATLYAAVEGHPPYPQQGNAIALLTTIASSPPPRPERAGFLADPIARMLDPDPDSRWTMQDAAHVLQRLEKRHGRDLTRAATSAVPVERERPAPATPTAAPAPETARVEPEERRRRRVGGGLLVAGLVGLLALAALIGFLLLNDGPADGPAAGQGHSRSASRSQRPSDTASTPAPSPTTSAPSSPSSPSGSDGTGPGATAAGAQQFVRGYYAALPSDTRSGWSLLSPGFQREIGGYGTYQGFWSTISSVSVDRTTNAGDGAVDTTLTYTSSDGSTQSEVRRIYVERSGSGYVITGDDVVG